jgi:uncharacterized protein YndB with AHSA1/START domain
MQTLSHIVNTIHLDAPLEMVWDALVNPAKTKIYLFGCEAVSDWKPGSELLWKGSHEGKEMIFVKGKIVSINPSQRLVYTVFDPNGTLADVPENYLSVTYDLSSIDGGSRLTVTQGDYTKVGDGARRYAESYNQGEGWNPILKAIKKLVEG